MFLVADMLSVTERTLERWRITGGEGAVCRVLAKLPRGDSPWVFPGADPAKPVSDLKKAWARVKGRAGIEGTFCLHQLRHTYASRLAGQGRSLYEVQQLHGHLTLRRGVSELRSGRRHTLVIIFHDAA